MNATHTPPRPSTAPHAKVERDVADLIVRTDNQRRNLDQLEWRLDDFKTEAVEAFQGVRAELDELRETSDRTLQLLANLAVATVAVREQRPHRDKIGTESGWSRFVGWLRRNAYDSTPKAATEDWRGWDWDGVG